MEKYFTVRSLLCTPVLLVFGFNERQGKISRIVFWITMTFLYTFWFSISPNSLAGDVKKSLQVCLCLVMISIFIQYVSEIHATWYSQTFMRLFTLNAIKSITERFPINLPSDLSEIANFPSDGENSIEMESFPGLSQKKRLCAATVGPNDLHICSSSYPLRFLHANITVFLLIHLC